MILIGGQKYACESCFKGHRVSKCTHADRPLFATKKKGRPLSQCQHCRNRRVSASVHNKCTCQAAVPTQASPCDCVTSGNCRCCQGKRGSSASGSTGQSLVSAPPDGKAKPASQFELATLHEPTFDIQMSSWRAVHPTLQEDAYPPLVSSYLSAHQPLGADLHLHTPYGIQHSNIAFPASHVATPSLTGPDNILAECLSRMYPDSIADNTPASRAYQTGVIAPPESQAEVQQVWNPGHRLTSMFNPMDQGRPCQLSQPTPRRDPGEQPFYGADGAAYGSQAITEAASDIWATFWNDNTSLFSNLPATGI